MTIMSYILRPITDELYQTLISKGIIKNSLEAGNILSKSSPDKQTERTFEENISENLTGHGLAPTNQESTQKHSCMITKWITFEMKYKFI